MSFIKQYFFGRLSNYILNNPLDVIAVMVKPRIILGVYIAIKIHADLLKSLVDKLEIASKSMASHLENSVNATCTFINDGHVFINKKRGRDINLPDID